MNASISDVDPELDQVSMSLEATVASEEPADWEQAVADSPPAVLGGGGVDNSAAVAAMVRLARGEMGVAESPPGSNSGTPLTRYVRYFGRGIGPSPWCAFFVSWAWDRASDGNHKVPWSNPGYVPSVEAWAQKVGRKVSSPIHGDLFGVAGDHIGIVVGSNPTKKIIYTVEGNYGGRVAGVSRNWSGLWFARLS